MPDQLTLVDAYGAIIAPPEPGTYPQVCLRFSGMGINAGRTIYSTLASTDPAHISASRQMIRDNQIRHGIEPDAIVMWRDITCTPWREDR